MFTLWHFCIILCSPHLQVQTSSTGDSVVIIPLHSLDYDYEAAAAVSKTSKNGVSGKTGTYPVDFVSAEIFWRDDRDCLIVEINVGQ